MEAALITGVQVILAGYVFMGNCQAHMLSKDGRCFTFDGSANGFARSEAVGSLCMKLQHYNEIDSLAVLNASYANQDGKSASLTAPSGPAQVQVISGVLKESQLHANEVDLTECHGTGTSLGDPIEVGSVCKVFYDKANTREAPFMFGSIKSNWGHAEGGAGMTGFIKCCLQVMHQEAAACLHLKALNPHIDFAGFPVALLQETVTNKADRGFCGVSGFGFGGTNAHCQAWGSNIMTSRCAANQELSTLFMKKIRALPPPEVKMEGPWQDWKSKGMPVLHDPNAHYCIRIVKTDVGERVQWEKVGDEGTNNDDQEFTDYAPKGLEGLENRLADYSSDVELAREAWEDLLADDSLTWTPPLLCNVFWRPAHEFHIEGERPVFRTALAELDGCRVAPALHTELRKLFNFPDAPLTFGGFPMTLQVKNRPVDISGLESLILPVSADIFLSSSGMLASKVLQAIQALAKIVTAKKSAVLLVLLTGAPHGLPIDNEVSNMPEFCCLRGIVRAVRAEIPRLHILHIDSDEFGFGGVASELASQVWFEVTNPRLGLHMEVAYRGGERHIPAVDLSPKRNPISSPAQVDGPSFRELSPLGWALIVGGSGQLGLLTAQVLVEAGLKKVFLTSRSGPVAGDLEGRIGPLRKLGGEIHVARLDPSDGGKLEAFLQETCHQHGPLRVVVYTADDEGSPDTAMVNYSSSSFKKLLSFRIEGARQLSLQTTAMDVAHFIVCCSLSSLVGDPGSLCRASLGTFMEELARSRQTQGLPGVCVQWPTVLGSSDGETSISEDCAKLVLKQILTGTQQLGPVQAVLPNRMLVPQTSHMASLLEPLFDRLALQRWQKKPEQIGSQ